jgi:HPt (histidine-containing phosphotransfer) domain-containing protein
MSDKLYNLDFVNSMAGGNQDFINQLLTLFVDSVPESIDLINKHYANNDLDNLAKEAHKLKSTINTVQIPSFIEKIKEIEMIGKTGEGLEKLPGLIAEFNEVMPKAVEQVKELL